MKSKSKSVRKNGAVVRMQRMFSTLVRALAKRWKSRITMIQVRGIYTDRIGEKMAGEIKKCLADLRKQARMAEVESRLTPGRDGAEDHD